MKTGPLWTILAVLLSGSSFPDAQIYMSKDHPGFWTEHFVFRDTNLNNIEKSLVMVSFKPGSSLDHFLTPGLWTEINIWSKYRSYSTGIGRALVQVHNTQSRDLLAELAHEDISSCGAIERWDPSQPHLTSSELGSADSPELPTSVKSPSLESLLTKISTDQLSSTVSMLQNLGTRFHASSSPNAAVDSISSLWRANAPTSATLTQKDHSSVGTTQKSVILSIPGTVNPDKVVIIGAHLDSINRADQTNAPGADDNATGVAAMTEILRVIKDHQLTFARTVEFHAYAAEEVGLLGSSDIAASYSKSGKHISSMLQMDMIGYSQTNSDKTIHIITTDTSPVLTRHLKDLTSNYLDGTWVTNTLAAGTSDHKSWLNYGFHSAFAFEHPTNYNHALHTAGDTTSLIDFNLAARFTKLALAFLAHEAGLTTASAETTSLWSKQFQKTSDIKLSIAKSSSGGDRLAAAISDETASSVEFCKIKDHSEYGCQAFVTDTTLAKTTRTIKFFVSPTDMTFVNNDSWRIHAYNSSGLVIASRDVILRKK